MSFHKLAAADALAISQSKPCGKLEQMLGLIEVLAKSGKRECQVAYDVTNKEHRDALYEISRELGYKVEDSEKFKNCVIISW